MAIKTKGKPFVMPKIIKPKTVLLVTIFFLVLWMTSDFWIGGAALATLVVSELWEWRPDAVIGLAMMLVPFVLAFPAHYFLEVRKTNHAGVVEVNSLGGYMSFVTMNISVRVIGYGSFFVGLFILLFGF